jgi:hypothetical protein
MEIKSLWIIIIRVIGCWFLLSSLVAIPELLTDVIFFGRNGGTEGIILWLLFIIFYIAFFFFILRFTIFRTPCLIEKLGLARGMPEGNLEVNIHRSVILRIAAIVIGSLLLVDNLPLFIKDIFQYWQVREGYQNILKSQRTPWLFLYGLKALAGYLLLYYNRQAVNFIELKRKTSNPGPK